MWKQPSDKKDLKFPKYQQYFTSSQDDLTNMAAAFESAERRAYPQLLTQLRDLAKNSAQQNANPLAGLLYLDLVIFLSRQDNEWENIFMAVAQLHQHFTQSEFQYYYLDQLTVEGKKWVARLLAAINTKFEKALVSDENTFSEAEKVDFQTKLLALQKTNSSVSIRP